MQAVLHRVSTWPVPLQEELVAVALEIESEMNGGEYETNEDELRIRF